MMRILIINGMDGGGAAIAAKRLFLSLKEVNDNCRLLVLSKKSHDPTSISPIKPISKLTNWARPTIDRIPLTLFGKQRIQSVSINWIFSPKFIFDQIEIFDPDIINIHWMGGGFLRIEDVAKMKRPIIWTMHDMWPLTGICHYSGECFEYKKSCSQCQIANSKLSKVIAKVNWKRKRRTYSKSKQIGFVSPSSWLYKIAKQSSLLSDKLIYHIPNPIDVEIFKPVEKSVAKNILGLDSQNKYILFGALDATSDRRKGLLEFIKSLKNIKNQKIRVIFMGDLSNDNNIKSGNLNRSNFYFMGRLYDNLSLRLLYSACDVVAVPSLQENLSNIIMEAMSCGTPVVAFDVGGNRDMVDHMENGFIANPSDSLDFGFGIEWILNNNEYEILSKRAREKITTNFRSDIIADMYLKTFNSLLSL